MKSIGTNQTHRLYCEKHRNQRKSIGCIVQNIGTNENKTLALMQKHRTNAKALVLHKKTWELTRNSPGL